jgi:peptidoglycan/xylan/chitin deacetylase (PgdA/CDA1 family)/outer membrane lipoprotein-sorting protein
MPLAPRGFVTTRRQIAALVIWVLIGGVLSAVPPVSVPPAWGQTGGGSPLAWLQSAAIAPLHVSYQGTKTVTVWTIGGQAQASQVRIFHEAPNRTRLEYVPAGNQPERIVVITGDTAVEFVPPRNQYIRRPARGVDEEAFAREILPQISKNYDVRFEPTSSVAGRVTRVLDVEGKFPGRPRLRAWVDVETHLILRFERYGPSGVLREASAFLNIRMNPLLSPDLFTVVPPAGAQVQTRPSNPGRMTIEEIARRVRFRPQIPAYVPPGYHLAGSRVSTIRGAPTATFAFTDGISTLTLFESRGPIAAPPNGRRVRIGSEEGTVVARGVATLLHWNSGGIAFTLVGDLSQDELVRVASSVPRVGALGGDSIERDPILKGRASVLHDPGGQTLSRLAGLFALPPAEAGPVPPGAAQGGVGPDDLPPVPISPYITNNTHPIGPGIRQEEEVIWQALAARGLTPFVVKVTVASDGVTTLPDGRVARLAWIWFVYGMNWAGGRPTILRQVQEAARVLADTALEADPRVDRVTLSGYFHRSGRFDGRRTDVTFTARLFRSRLAGLPPRLDPGATLARGGDVWYSPDLLAGTLTEEMPMAHDPHLPLGMRAPGPAPAGDRTVESAERFQGTVWERILETKDRLAGLFFGIESGGRLWRGNPLRREIALTFDDGPSPLTTPLLLAVLRRYGVHGTFFVIGEHARTYPYLIREMVADGHEVSDHTFHHPNMTTLDGDTVAQEIGATAIVIQDVTGQRPRWFRPPGGDYTAGVAAAAHRAGMGLAMWTENSGDWALPPAKTVADRVLIRAEPGSIVLLHSTVMNTLRALPQIIVSLQRRGYTLVTISQLVRDAE